MNSTVNNATEKLFFGLALGAAGLSLVWFGPPEERPGDLRAEATTLFISGRAYIGSNWVLPGKTGAAWMTPPPQAKGSGWHYELFTPPVIFMNAGAGTFSVTRPAPAEDPVEGTAGLELLAVRRQPYRLQLLGYCGEPGNYLGVFVCPLSAETLLARPGHHFEALGLWLKSFDVRKVIAGGNEAEPVWEIAALAVLQDEAAGTEVVLDSRLRRYTDRALAAFKVPGTASKPRELLEGGTMTAEGVSYRIARIQLDPPEVVVARTAEGRPGPEMQLMRPLAQITGKDLPSQPPVPMAATGPARNEQVILSP